MCTHVCLFFKLPMQLSLRTIGLDGEKMPLGEAALRPKWWRGGSMGIMVEESSLWNRALPPTLASSQRGGWGWGAVCRQRDRDEGGCRAHRLLFIHTLGFHSKYITPLCWGPPVMLGSLWQGEWCELLERTLGTPWSTDCRWSSESSFKWVGPGPLQESEKQKWSNPGYVL